MVKKVPAIQETRVRSLGQEDPLEKGMVTHSSILAWRMPGTEEPGRLQSMGLERVGHDRVTNTFLLRQFGSIEKSWNLELGGSCFWVCHLSVLRAAAGSLTSLSIILVIFTTNYHRGVNEKMCVIIPRL